MDDIPQLFWIGARKTKTKRKTNRKKHTPLYPRTVSDKKPLALPGLSASAYT